MNFKAAAPMSKEWVTAHGLGFLGGLAVMTAAIVVLGPALKATLPVLIATALTVQTLVSTLISGQLLRQSRSPALVGAAVVQAALIGLVTFGLLSWFM